MAKAQRDIEFYTNWAYSRGGTMLEVACGTGRILVPALEMGADIEGIDISPEMLDFCRQKLKEK